MSNIKVIERLGKSPGKTIVLLAGVHGNETCGVEAFKELIPNLSISSGKVIFIYANIEAIKQNKRQIDYNLNRCFLKNQPEEIKKTLESKTAKEIMPYLEKADLILDIHASFTEGSMPFLICDEQQLEKSKIFDVDIISYNWDSFEPGSTEYYMNLQGKPGFCIECGFLGNKESNEKAKQAILNFLAFARCINREVKERENQRIIKIKSIYKNKDKFTLSRIFKDFEKLSEKTLIGLDGREKIFADKGDIILFARNSQGLEEECFLLAEERLLNEGNWIS